MNQEKDPEKQVGLSPRADIVSDIAGYFLAAAILSIMFVLSGSLY